MRTRSGSIALVVAIALIARPSFTGAQAADRTLVGRVTAAGTGEPVLGAEVGVEGTLLAARTDSLGRWVLVDVPVGSQVVVVRRIGFAPTRMPVVVPVRGVLTVDVTLSLNPLGLEQIIVTAEGTRRARDELGTASVIERDAIANQISSSLQGVLELLPGVPLQPPGLDAAAQFSLRSLDAASSIAANIGAAGTLIILDGVPLSNNANLQTVGSRGEITPPASTAGGGIDLRRIPAATLDRVEVIRGIPSVRWGDLTQGAIIVDTRAASVAPEGAGRLDPRTGEGTVLGGRSWSTDRQALTATFNLAQTRQARTLSSATTIRGAAQVAHHYDDFRRTFDTRVDWYQLRFESPEREDIEPGRNSFQDDWGIRVSERARLHTDNGVLEWTLAVDLQDQLTRESRRLARPAMPFTDRIEEGRTIGSFIIGAYDGAYTLEGAPRLAYSRLEWDQRPERQLGPITIVQTRLGAELRREWNAGVGYTFDIARPPQASTLTAVSGFDRPRKFGDIPALVTSAAYADTRLMAQSGGVIAEVQPGVRVDVLHRGDWWATGAQSTSFEPRITAQVSPRPWLRVRAGAGRLSKLPTVNQLHPAPQYYDIVNVNRYTPDPAERLAVLTTFIRDPRNPCLAHARASKQEIGFDLDGGRRWGSLSITWFDDGINGAVTSQRDPLALVRDHYELVDTATGSGQPGRIVDPPIASDPVPIFLARNVNGGRMTTRGIEYAVNLPAVPTLRTWLEVSGAMVETRFAISDRDYGSPLSVNSFQVDSTIRRIPYFAGPASRSQRGIVTWRLVHHQPRIGLVLTGTVQQRVNFEQQVLSQRDSLGFLGYVTRTGELVPVPESDKLLPEYADLRRAPTGVPPFFVRQPDDWMFSLQVAKSIGSGGRLSFYVFNALDKLATFGGGAVRTLPASRFGAELSLPTAALWGDRW